MMTDDGLLGMAKVEEPITAKPSGPPPPKFYYINYFWDGTYVRVHPGDGDAREWSKEALEKDGWYVTADYTTDPPRVILTKEPTENSQWRFVPGSKRPRYYIKNENGREKDAWLNTVDTGKRYSYAGIDGRYRDARVYMAVISFSKKREYGVISAKADGAK